MSELQKQLDPQCFRTYFPWFSVLTTAHAHFYGKQITLIKISASLKLDFLQRFSQLQIFNQFQTQSFANGIKTVDFIQNKGMNKQTKPFSLAKCF